MKEINFEEVRQDIKNVLTKSQKFWPADYGNYGPLFIRLTWHAAGSYRESDGRGGTDGGRQRFDPERSWDDNTNLDKARKLLEPIKDKYGLGLSWGDLLVLAGDTAIKEMGGPILGFCGGRIDDTSGKDSRLLGPSKEQEKYMPCDPNKLCQRPLGASVIGLIYVNPVGPMGEPIPKKSADDIRDVFARMNMNDEETIALIAGGHEFGKAHGPCIGNAGDPPNKDPHNPWAGTCGQGSMQGKGVNTFTSGLELPWTTNPVSWDHEYFENLFKYQNSWVKHLGPAGTGKWQWKINGGAGPKAPNADGNGAQNIGMLTTDIALLHDTKFLNISKTFHSNKEYFKKIFKNAWYKLTTRDMGPRSRCINADAPPHQPWQIPLPEPPPIHTVKYNDAEKELNDLMNQEPEATGMFARLAYQCSSNFRATDYMGGCNGARIRFEPQKDWEENTGLDSALNKLTRIKRSQHGKHLSWADLVILAGNVAISKRTGQTMDFCPGRTDVLKEDGGPDFFRPKLGDAYKIPSVEDVHDAISISGLTTNEFVALYGAGYVIGDTKNCNGLYCLRASFVTTTTPSALMPTLSNELFTLLFDETWDMNMNIKSVFRIRGISMYKARGKEKYMLPQDLYFKDDSKLSMVSKEYAQNNKLYLDRFAKAWTKLSNIDRFDGPFENPCNT